MASTIKKWAASKKPTSSPVSADAARRARGDALRRKAQEATGRGAWVEAYNAYEVAADAYEEDNAPIFANFMRLMAANQLLNKKNEEEEKAKVK